MHDTDALNEVERAKAFVQGELDKLSADPREQLIVMLATIAAGGVDVGRRAAALVYKAKSGHSAVQADMEQLRECLIGLQAVRELIDELC